MSSPPPTQTEFNDCPRCKVGKLKPAGRAGITNDPQINKVTDTYREYMCDNCGYPDAEDKGSRAKVLMSMKM